MNHDRLLRVLSETWRDYLRQQGHFIYKTDKQQLCRSRNSNKLRYAWLLLVSNETVRYLQPPELKHMCYCMEYTSRRGERCYLVVGFAIEHPRIVVLPAEKALETGYVRADVGGINWDI